MSPGTTSKARLAHQAVALAIKSGELLRQPCEVCGEADLVEAHHETYDKPLDVRWLCALHHRQLHVLRRTRLTDTLLTHNSETLAIADWAGRHRMSPSTLYQRIVRLGWPAALALSLKPSLSYVSKPDKHTYSCGGAMSCRAARETAFRFQRSSPRKANPEKQVA